MKVHPFYIWPSLYFLKFFFNICSPFLLVIYIHYINHFPFVPSAEMSYILVLLFLTFSFGQIKSILFISYLIFTYLKDKSICLLILLTVAAILIFPYISNNSVWQNISLHNIEFIICITPITAANEDMQNSLSQLWQCQQCKWVTFVLRILLHVLGR